MGRKAPPPPSTTERPLLVRYQRRWLADRARKKLLVKSRRIGGSFVVALEDAWAAAGFGYDERGRPYYRPERGVDQRIVSASHAQSKELLEEVGRHLENLSLVVGRELIASSSQTVIRLRNGVKCIALAPNPRTVRGGKGDLTLDEFGAMPRSREIWAAAKAITDPTLGRPFGYKLRALGSPLGDDNMFYELACTDAGKAFSRHFVTVHDAVKDGFPADIDVLREEAGDADMFAQEYECAFLSASARYITADLYDSCLFDDEERPTARGVGYAGYDIARKERGDLASIVELRRVATTLWHELTEARRGATWDDQEEWVAEVLRRCSRMAADATGMGSQHAERLTTKHGISRFEPVEFTQKSKELLATGLRLAIERHRLRLRRDDVDLRRDVLSLRREITKAGNIRFDAERIKDGKGYTHGDRAWALALAVHAAGQPPGKKAGSTTETRSEAEQIAVGF